MLIQSNDPKAAFVKSIKQKKFDIISANARGDMVTAQGLIDELEFLKYQCRLEGLTEQLQVLEQDPFV